MTNRRFHICLSLVALLLLMGYAYMHGKDIRMMRFQPSNLPVRSFDMKKIQEIQSVSIVIEDINKQPMTIQLKEPPPFKAGDVVSFQIEKMSDGNKLVEFHVWEPLSHWYLKAFLSVIPVVFVVHLFFKGFRFNRRRGVFEMRRGPHA